MYRWGQRTKTDSHVSQGEAGEKGDEGTPVSETPPYCGF